MAKRLFSVLVIASLGLAACATHGQIGKPFSAAGREKLRIDWTTRSQARRLVGDPRTIVTGADGLETWVYEHTEVSALALPFIGGVAARQTPHVLLRLRFQYGVLAACEFYQETYRSKGTRILSTATISEACAG